MTDVVVAVGLVKRYRSGDEEIHAVRDASFALAGGELTVLSGPSGSGKTTLLNLLVGFEQPDAGTLVWPDRPRGATPMPWSDVAVVPQALGLLDELTVVENVLLPLRLVSRRLAEERRAAVEQLLVDLGLDHIEQHRPREASLGEQQRTAIARAVIVGPQLLVLDEPTAHQDADSAGRVIDAMTRAAFAGSAVLAATHDPLVLAVAHRRLRIADGALAAGQ